MDLHLAKNTISTASHIALEDAGLPHTLHWVNFADREQTSPEYLAINPKARVPALIVEGRVLTETPAILLYIADNAPDLAPTDPWGRAQLNEWLSYLASTMHVNHAHKFRGSRWTPDKDAHKAMAAHVPTTMAASCAYVEDKLHDSGWALEAFSVADMHLYAISRWLKGDGVDVTDYPRLNAHFNEMRKRASVQTVEALHG